MTTVNIKPHTIPIEHVLVGSRIRCDLGDIDDLVRSIEEVGVLQPIAIRSDGALVAGARRLAAYKALGWERVPVHVDNVAEIPQAEFAENAYRKPFTPSEIFKIWQKLEPIERAAAQERQKATRFGSGGGKFPPPSKGKTRDKVAAFAGVSGRNLNKIAEVMRAAETDPRFEPLVKQMDQCGHVDGAYRQLQAHESSGPGT